MFTRGIGSWWPLETHSIARRDAGRRPQELHLELREGGRFYERSTARSTRGAAFSRYDPPRRVVIEWHVNPENPATEIEVTFTPEGGGTRVELVHSGWERFGEPGRDARRVRRRERLDDGARPATRGAPRRNRGVSC